MSNTPIDPQNPSIPEAAIPKINPEYLAAQQKIADAAALMAQGNSGEPVTEGGIYIRFLCAVLTGRLAGNSNDAQIWATDLTRDYLTKYDLTGNPRSNSPVASQ